MILVFHSRFNYQHELRFSVLIFFSQRAILEFFQQCFFHGIGICDWLDWRLFLEEKKLNCILILFYYIRSFFLRLEDWLTNPFFIHSFIFIWRLDVLKKLCVMKLELFFSPFHLRFYLVLVFIVRNLVDWNVWLGVWIFSYTISVYDLGW